MVTQHFILHIVPDEVRPRIYLSQRSTGLEKLQFTMVGTNGAYYSIPANTSVTMVGSKPDKTVFSYACTYSGNTVYCDVTDQMTAVAGIVTAELRFANNQGNVIPSQNMEIFVERSPIDGMTCSKNDLVSVEDEVESISQDVALAKRYAEEAQAAGTQAVADITSTKNSAISTVNSTKDSAVDTVNSAVSSATSTVESTKNSAVSTINAKESEAEAAFEDAVSRIEQYGTAGVTLEYITETESFKIMPIENP